MACPNGNSTETISIARPYRLWRLTDINAQWMPTRNPQIAQITPIGNRTVRFRHLAAGDWASPDGLVLLALLKMKGDLPAGRATYQLIFVVQV